MADLQKAASIQNAFLLGWSIVELKSRILLKALQPLSPTTPAPTMLTPKDTIENALGVIQNLEAHTTAITQPSLADDDDGYADASHLPTETNDSIWLTSVWRGVFERIASLHNACFPSIYAEQTAPRPPDEDDNNHSDDSDNSDDGNRSDDTNNSDNSNRSDNAGDSGDAAHSGGDDSQPGDDSHSDNA